MIVLLGLRYVRANRNQSLVAGSQQRKVHCPHDVTLVQRQILTQIWGAAKRKRVNDPDSSFDASVAL
jgi:hypothetical protein